VSSSTLRKSLLRFAKLCYHNQFVSAYEGNLSIRTPNNKILITAHHTCKGFLRESDIVTVRLDAARYISHSPGSQRNRLPSTEVRLHKYIYEHRSDVNAVVHTHPVFCTAFAAAGLALDKMVFPEIILTLRKIPLANYAPPTTDEIAKSLKDYIIDYDAVLLQNHGLITYGSNMEDAYFKTEQVEHIASVTFYARLLGGEKQLSPAQIQKLKSLRLE